MEAQPGVGGPSWGDLTLPAVSSSRRACIGMKDQPAAQKPVSSEAPTLTQSVIVELSFGVIGLILVVVTGHSLSEAFRVEINPLVAGSFGILIGACLGSIFGLGVTRPPIADRVRPFLQRFTSAAPTPLNFAVIGLAAALGEETLFRAAIQPAAGIVVSSLLFMLAHSLIADFRHPTIGKAAYAVLAFTMGLLLGVMYDRLGIAASMGTHFAFDTAALLVIRPLLPTIVLATPGAG